MSESDYGYTKNEIERQELDDAARAQYIDAVINSLPPELMSWIEQLPPFESRQALYDLMDAFYELYDEAFEAGIRKANVYDRMPWPVDKEFMPKKGGVND